jgi:hypothetical protein
MWVGGQRHPLAAFPPGKNQYPLYRWLGGPQSQSGLVRKISPPPGFDPWTVHPITSRYTDWAILAHWRACKEGKVLVWSICSSTHSHRQHWTCQLHITVYTLQHNTQYIDIHPNNSTKFTDQLAVQAVTALDICVFIYKYLIVKNSN